MKKLISILSLSILVFSANCWDTSETNKINFTEGGGYIILSFKDSKNCKPIINANVKFMGVDMKTDDKGYIAFKEKYIIDMDEAKLPLKISKKGYIPFDSFAHVKSGSVWNGKYLLSKRMPIHSVRFILQWENKPKDLDLHLVSTDFHLSYREKSNNRAFAELDRDDQDGYGPETITLKKINKNKKYSIYIHNYSKRPKPNKIRLSVYVNNKLSKVLVIDKFKSNGMRVLDINNGIINYVKEDIKTIPKYLKSN